MAYSWHGVTWAAFEGLVMAAASFSGNKSSATKRQPTKRALDAGDSARFQAVSWVQAGSIKTALSRLAWVVEPVETHQYPEVA